MSITNDTKAQERIIQVLHEMGFVHQDEIEARILADQSFIHDLVDKNPTDAEIAMAIEEYIAD